MSLFSRNEGLFHFKRARIKINVNAAESKSRWPQKTTAENQYTCHDLSVWNKLQKITFAQLRLNPPEHNLPATEKNPLEKAAF